MHPFAERFNLFLGICLVILGILLAPPVFNLLFAVSPLLDGEAGRLTILAGLAIISGSAIILLRSKLNSSIGVFIFGMISLIYMEMGFRLAAHFFMNPGSMHIMSKVSLQTYDTYSAFMGHPFLGYTRRPNVRLDGSEDIHPIYNYNKYGFNGLEVDYIKPKGTIRIAAMGGSTTARGYPEKLQVLLDAQYTENKIEVLNFGISGWSSAHTMVNYLLNVVAFDPDYIVLHQGWNEETVRNVPGVNFRPDYSHVYSFYREPIIWDRYLLRTSLIYRYILSKLDRTPPWAYLEQSTTLTNRERTNLDFSNLEELRSFERNTKTVIDHARNLGIKVVLTTIPYSTDEKLAHFYMHTNIDQCNEVTSSIATREITFVDLDSMMTGKMNDLFIDLGHLNEAGMEFKAKQIGNAILFDLKNDTSNTNPLSSIQP